MMPITEEQLLSWTARAASIPERLGAEFVVGPRTEEGDALFARWSTSLGAGAEAIERRLSWSGVDEERARAACAGARLAGGAARLPRWARMLRTVFDSPLAPAAEQAFYTKEGSWPFQDVLAPLVSKTSSLIAEEAWGAVEPTARIGLERQLLSLLCEASVAVLDREFQVDRAVSRAVRGPVAGNLYERFADRMLHGGGWQKTFSAYPVMARLMGTRMDFWLANTREFLERLAADRQSLQAMFRPEGLGKVELLRPGLSDPHHSGRTAIWVSFDSGFECVYKPRNIDSEPAFQSLLGWLVDRGLDVGMRGFRSLTRADYGWSEAVPQLPCEDESAVRRYYRRIGALAAVLYGLGASDCHQENVIACGEFPVLIDTETILTPTMVEFPGNIEYGTAAGVAQNLQFHSVLKSLLLPPGSHLPGRDYSHLVGVMRADADPTFQVLTWVNPNSDWMRLREQEIKMPAERNQVMLNGAPAGAEQYVDEIAAGFETAYRVMLEHRQALIAGPLEEMRSLPIRAVCRATRIYGTLLARTSDPTLAGDGSEASIAHDILARPFLAAPERPPMFSLIAAELRSMAQGDVPLFSTTGDGHDIVSTDGETIEKFFVTSGCDNMRQSLDGLSLSDLQAQKSMIRGAFATVPYQARPEKDAAMPVVLKNDEFLREALAIAKRIGDSAIRGEDGSCLWLTVHPVGDDGWTLGAASHSLYGGLSGIALFLSAVYKVTGDPYWKELALGALETVRGLIVTDPATGLYPYASLGGGGGIPSTAYAVLRCADLLGDAGLRDEARRLGMLVTPELIEKDAEYDLISGAAGTILCLLELYRSLGDAGLLHLATMCGDHLLRRRSENGSEHRSWATLDDTHLAGLTHGAAGIALALERLYGVTGNPAYRDAALEAIRYEDTLFHAEKSNWPDLRKKDTYTGSWCHGAPGIGLARLEFLGIAPEAATDVEASLAYTLNAASSRVDHVCCGDLGLVEFLHVAGEALHRPELTDSARAMASQLVAGARERSHYRLNWNERFDWPTFHQGLAGIGYELLRLAASEALPSILRWN